MRIKNKEAELKEKMQEITELKYAIENLENVILDFSEFSRIYKFIDEEINEFEMKLQELEKEAEELENQIDCYWEEDNNNYNNYMINRNGGLL